MGKYLAEQQRKERVQRKTLHPVWYGIGCLMTILTPIISWAASALVLDYGISQKWSYIYAMSGSIPFPAIFYKLPVISQAANYIGGIPFFEGYLIFFVLFLLLFSGIFAILNAILYRLFGPPRYTDIDAPPIPKRSPKKSR